MTTIINIPPEVYTEIKSHLLTSLQLTEEAAFIFADVVFNIEQMHLNYKEWYAVKPNDYESRSAYHFELTYDTNTRIIKRAHDLNACIIELHSHIDQEFVRFSPTDWNGFLEFVPHVLWRLKGKPYVAVVLNDQEIDALVWVDDIKDPIGLSAITTGEINLIPTNNSLKQWNHD